MSRFGVDYAWGRPGATALLAANVTFAARYLSHDTSGKNLDAGEAASLSSHGLDLVTVWESTADRALSGRSGGVADARAAVDQLRAIGMPADMPIYFAADWDADSGDQVAINAYLDGTASVIGRGRVGLYGGFWPIKRAFDAGKITYGWQTYAWSGGNWDPRAQLQQYSNDHVINGVGLDYDRAMKADFGQRRVGQTMALTDDDVAKIAKAVWQTDNLVPAAGVEWNADYWTGAYHLFNLGNQIRAVAAGGGSDSAAIVAGVLAGLSPTALATAIADQLGPDVATEVLDALTARLAS